MRILCYQIGVALLAIVIGASGAQAQQQSQDQQQNQNGSQSQSGAQPEQNQDQSQQPIPAYHSPLANLGGQGNAEEGTENLTPDDRPLSGAEYFSVGRALGRSYWQPNLGAVITEDSNPLGSTGWMTYGSILGGLDLRVIHGISDLNLNYFGGGTFSNASGIGNTVVQSLGVTEEIKGRRTSLSLIDSFSDLPEASFGFGAVVGASPGLTTTALQPGFAPEGSILTGLGQQINNSFVAQLNRNFTGRSSVTLLGSYYLLHFFNSSLLDSAVVSAQGGYNYLVTRKDTIAVYYRFDQDRYSTYSPTIDNHTVQVSYGRRVTGRLAFQLAGGPEISFYPNAVPGGLGGVSANSTMHIYWSVNTGLTYKLERASLGLGYMHWVSPGSGVFLGALSDQFTGTVSRQFSRLATVGLSGGYARNKGLGISGVTVSNQTYNYSYGGVTLGEQLSRALALNLNYQFQYQDSNAGFCIGPSCGTSFTRHIVSLGFNWTAKPIPFE
jgi:hypothetical protein